MATGMHSLVPAIEQAARLYQGEGMELHADISNYLVHPHGYVIKRPDLFLLARPIVLDDPERWLKRDELGEANAWFVKMLVGTWAAALREMPHPLPFCCWHRQFTQGPTGRLHVVATERLQKKIA